MTILRILAWWFLLSVPVGMLVGRWLRGRSGDDLADLARLQHQLDREREHSKHLAAQLAEAHELNRKLIEGRDTWRSEARRLSGDLVALKAQRRAEAS